MTNRAYVGLTGIIRMLAIWSGLLLWQWSADSIDCVVSALLLVPLWGVLTLAASEAALMKRYAFVALYLRAEGMLTRLLRRRIALLLWQGVKNLILALILLVSAVFLEHGQWLVLLADILLLTLFVVMFNQILSKEIKPGYRAFLSRQWAHRINALLLWLCLVLVTFHTAHENYTGLSWLQVMHLGASKVTIACDELALLGRVNSVSEALMWWGAQNYLRELEHPTQLIMAWLAFLAFFGVSFLIAWAYSRALVGVLCRPWSIDPERLSNEK